MIFRIEVNYDTPEHAGDPGGWHYTVKYLPSLGAPVFVHEGYAGWRWVAVLKAKWSAHRYAHGYRYGQGPIGRTFQYLV